jgi:hypothetical protein
MATMTWLNSVSSLPSLSLIVAFTRLVAAVLDLLDIGPGHDGHALLDQRLFEEGGNIGILDRDDPVHHLDDGHVRAHVVVEAGEFDADRARTDDQQLARHFRRRHGVAIGPDALAVGRRERQVARPRAGRDDDVLGFSVSFEPFSPVTSSLPLPSACRAHMHGDLVLLHQVGDALIELLRHAARALHHRLEIGADLFRRQAIIRKRAAYNGTPRPNAAAPWWGCSPS